MYTTFPLARIGPTMFEDIYLLSTRFSVLAIVITCFVLGICSKKGEIGFGVLFLLSFLETVALIASVDYQHAIAMRDPNSRIFIDSVAKGIVFILIFCFLPAGLVYWINRLIFWLGFKLRLLIRLLSGCD